jgi:hypothetical protein
MQTSELEMLSQRIKEAEERLRRVEEESEELSQGEPTPPISPGEKPLPPRPISRDAPTETNRNLGKEEGIEREW